MNALEFGSVLKLLVDAYPNAAFPRKTADIYEQMLGDLPADVFTAAAMDCMQRLKFFPSIAELRAAALSVSGVGDSIPTAVEAWQIVMDNLGNRNLMPPLGHPLIERAAKAIGWWNLNMIPREDLRFERMRFERLYDTWRRKELEEVTRGPQVQRMIGTVETRGLLESGSITEDFEEVGTWREEDLDAALD